MTEPAGRPVPEDGYRLWLRYAPVADGVRLAEYRAALSEVLFPAPSPTLRAAHDELMHGLFGLLGAAPRAVDTLSGGLIAGTKQSTPLLESLELAAELERAGREGYALVRRRVNGAECLVLAANTDIGVLYGVFGLLRLLATERSLESLSLVDAPRSQLRLLNHWDNLDRTIERGYAGFSLWDWHKLPDYVSPRYTDYARANASLGINGAVLTNVNANSVVLRPEYLEKVRALAEVFRPYGIRVYLTARFSAPMELGKLPTADPLDADVAHFWREKATELYRAIPDFGGFVVKANSEGQPGPHDYGRTHADGANVLADALAEHGGLVIWRAFVYDQDVPTDRARQAYDQLVPLDGAFRPNVLLQVKNGPIDFQPREPFHPLFGAMPNTPLLLEFQITQEYLGFATHLAYLAPLFEETLNADTHAQGPGSLVGRVVDGSLHGYARSGLAGVSNIGDERTWCGHPFAAANWYAFGRLAWDWTLSSERIADEWLRQTFCTDPRFLEPARAMMLGSREAVVEYMTPLGLHHLMARDHHYGPGPWVAGGRADWTSVYYHRADADGIGFDRTASGSNAVETYFPPVRERFATSKTCPESLLLWFHHLPWDHRLRSGRTLWDELCLRYQAGVEAVRKMRATWEGLEAFVDAARHRHVRALLAIQEKEARWWRDACVLYFQTFSQRPLPEGCEPPEASLEHYMSLEHRYVPGI